jgi:vanillate O-demethylase ferredoxin subunit
MQTEPLRLRVTQFQAEAKDVVSLELRDAGGKPLPAFAPGAHLEITVPSTGASSAPLIRHYSLCNDARERDRYVVAVGRVQDGRGGSQSVHEGVRVGATLMVQPPRNNFPLVDDAGHYRFIAGGIGITPILSMVRWCEAHNKTWSLLYCTRSRQRTAFLEELKSFGERVRFHFDDEAGGPLDVASALAHSLADEHVFCCGPKPLMLAVEGHCASRDPTRVHFEWFSAKEVAHDAGASRPFSVILRQSGVTLDVPADRSILETMEDHGLSVPFSCREGLCRTCETPICAGEADHRDHVLSDSERRAQRSILICVSRARGDVLELDA